MTSPVSTPVCPSTPGSQCGNGPPVRENSGRLRDQMPRSNDMIGGLRTDGIGGYHTVAQSGNEHRTVIRMRQQLAQQRAERLAGTRKRILSRRMSASSSSVR